MTPRPTGRSPKFIIFTTIFIDLLGFGIIIPTLPVIAAEFVERPSLQGKAAGLLMLVYSLLQMFFSPVWGRLSDRYGRRPILLLSLFGSTASYLLFAVSRSYELLLVSRLLAGLCGANITAAQAYIADITSEKDRTAGMGLVGMAFGLGFAFGPIFGGGATHLWQIYFPSMPAHVGPGVAATLICGLNFLAATVRLPESLPPERRGQTKFRKFATLREVGETLSHRVVGPLVVLFFMITFALANLEVSFSLYARGALGLDLRHIYGLFVYIGVVMALVQGYVVRKAVRVVPEPVLICAGIVLIVGGLALLPMSATVPWLLGTMTILSFGQGICTPSVMSLISRCAAGTAQGRVLGTSQSASSLARIVGPMFGGVFFDIGHRVPFWAAAGVMALAFGVAMRMRRRLIWFGPGGAGVEEDKKLETGVSSAGARD